MRPIEFLQFSVSVAKYPIQGINNIFEWINRTSSARYKSTRNSVKKMNNNMSVLESFCFQQKVCSVLTSSCTLYFSLLTGITISQKNQENFYYFVYSSHLDVIAFFDCPWES